MSECGSWQSEQRDALRVHPALHERAPVVDLVAHLPVVPVEVVVEQREPVRVERRLAVHVVVGDAARARVAARAGVDLARSTRAARCAARCPCRRPASRSRPCARPSAAARPLGRCERFAVALLLAQATWFEPGPWHASQDDVQLRPRRLERMPPSASKFLRRLVEWHSAHVKFQFWLPPVQCSGSPRLDVLSGIEVEPALPALRLRAANPTRCRAPACGRREARSGTAAADATPNVYLIS